MSTVLIIEDDLRVARGIEDQIKSKTSLNVEIASDFYGAREIIKKEKLDLIISDLQMPRRGLRKKPNEKGTMLSGWFFLCEMLEKKDEYPEYTKLFEQKKIIFFSAYLDRLNNAVKSDPDKKAWLNSIIQVKKELTISGDGGLPGLIKKVEEMI